METESEHMRRHATVAATCSATPVVVPTQHLHLHYTLPADGNATSRHAQSHHFLSFLFKFPVQKKTGQCVSVTFHDLAA